MLQFHPKYSDLLSSVWKPERLKYTRNIILPVVLCGCEIWYLTVKEEHRRMVFKNKMLRKIFGPKNEELTADWRGMQNVKIGNAQVVPFLKKNIPKYMLTIDLVYVEMFYYHFKNSLETSYYVLLKSFVRQYINERRPHYSSCMAALYFSSFPLKPSTFFSTLVECVPPLP